MPTPILTTTRHLNDAADAICSRTGIGRGQKSLVLNALAAAIGGPRKNWGGLVHHEGVLVSPRGKDDPDLGALLATSVPVAPVPDILAWRTDAIRDARDAYQDIIDADPAFFEGMEPTSDRIDLFLNTAASTFVCDLVQRHGEGNLRALIGRKGILPAIPELVAAEDPDDLRALRDRIFAPVPAAEPVPAWMVPAIEAAKGAFQYVLSADDLAIFDGYDLTEGQIDALCAKAARTFVLEQDSSQGVGVFESTLARLGTDAVIHDAILNDAWDLLYEARDELFGPPEEQDDASEG